MRGNVFILTEGACHKTGAGLPGRGWCPAPLGLPAAPVPIEASAPGCLRAPLAHALTSDLLGWGSGSRADPAGSNLGGVSRAAGGHWVAPRTRLRPRSAAGHGQAIPWGLILGLARQLGGAIRSRLLACDPASQPTLYMALGIPRKLWQGPGLAGSLAGRPAAGGSLGLKLYRLPCLARTDRSPVKHLGSALPGPNPRKARMSWGLPSRPHSWSLPLACCSRAISGSGSPATVPGSPWASSWAGQARPVASCAMGSAIPGPESCSWAWGAAGPGGLGTLGSRTSWSLGSRAP